MLASNNPFQQPITNRKLYCTVTIRDCPYYFSVGYTQRDHMCNETIREQFCAANTLKNIEGKGETMWNERRLNEWMNYLIN
jgi:hypothetical protein